MNYYVQYYHKGVLTGKLTPACGDRAVLILDGRHNLQTLKAEAATMNRPEYNGFQIFKGELTGRNCRALTEICPC